MPASSLSQHPHIQHLLTLKQATEVTALPVAQQQDDHSCGLFAIAFMFDLSGGVLTEEVKKQFVDTKNPDNVRLRVKQLWSNKQVDVEDLSDS